MTTNKSTGPRTESGKAISSQNALRHGLASSTILIPGEDPEQFAALQDGLLTQYKPKDLTEELLVTDMAKHHWLKDRALRLQGEALALAKPGELPATFAVLLRYQTANERAFHKALTALQALRKQKQAKETDELQFLSKLRKKAADKAIDEDNAYIMGPMPDDQPYQEDDELSNLTPDSPRQHAQM